MKIAELPSSSYAPYYEVYISKVDKTLTLLEALHTGMDKTTSFFRSLPQDRINYRYALGKWSPKEILRHIIDTERIFSYRALRLGRKDKTPIIGFDQDIYVNATHLEGVTMVNLLKEYRAVRTATIALFETFLEDNYHFIGRASDMQLSAGAAGTIIAGHEIYHVQVINERYL